MCMYVEHWNIFMVNKHDLQKKIKKQTKNVHQHMNLVNAFWWGYHLDETIGKGRPWLS